jgi:hypothetical protein
VKLIKFTAAGPIDVPGWINPEMVTAVMEAQFAVTEGGPTQFGTAVYTTDGRHYLVRESMEEAVEMLTGPSTGAISVGGRTKDGQRLN